MHAFEPIELHDTHFVAKGSHNLVYRHPTDETYLIKVLGIVKVLGLIPQLDTVQGLSHRFKNSKWLGTSKLMRFINQYRLTKAHVREFREIIRARFHDEFLHQPPPFMQKSMGFIDTNLGFALVVKAERDRHLNYAPTLETLIKNNQVDETVRAKLNLLCQQILEYDLILSDLHPNNLVYAYSETHGDHFVLIDGVGDKNIIPIYSLSPYLRRRAQLKKINWLKAHLPEHAF